MNGLNSCFALARTAVATAAALALAACVQLGGDVATEYSDDYSRDMFNTGYRFINERYIAPVSLRDLSISGLAGLHQIDSGLTIGPRATPRASHARPRPR